jgi:hypothetical protein
MKLEVVFTPLVPISAFVCGKVLIFPPPKARHSGWTFYFAEAAMTAEEKTRNEESGAMD